jgi:hypothetical protein
MPTKNAIEKSVKGASRRACSASGHKPWRWSPATMIAVVDLIQVGLPTQFACALLEIFDLLAPS